jgi:uncharacterized membrane protein YcgQ (UPF0703/DUF1980 family)
MKKIFIFVLLLLAAAFSLSMGIKKNPNAAQDGVLEIRDKLFIAQTNEIYVNAKDYIGCKIKYQGVFGRYVQADGDIKNYYVIRYGPGCCGNDAYVGFEVVLDGDPADTDYPQENDWVDVLGTLEEYEYEGEKTLRIRLLSLKVLQERGVETVKN